MMITFLKKFEHLIVGALIVMMAFVITVSTIELGWLIIKDLKAPPLLVLTIADLLEIFGFFMLILIGIELLETIRAYLVNNVVHVEIVLEVALIAIARKVIILDVEKYDGLTIIGIAALIFTIAAAFYAVKRRIKEKRAI
jgi:uncharacterized membrane protein (DUF373 family)